MRPTHIEIDTAIIRENLRRIKDSLPEWSTSTAVIKANGYGHGSVMVGRIAVEEGYESLAVAFPEEALPLRAAGIMVPIYLLGITLPQSFDLIVEGNSRPAICESTDLAALEACAARMIRLLNVVLPLIRGCIVSVFIRITPWILCKKWKRIRIYMWMGSFLIWPALMRPIKPVRTNKRPCSAIWWK